MAHSTPDNRFDEDKTPLASETASSALSSLHHNTPQDAPTVQGNSLTGASASALSSRDQGSSSGSNDPVTVAQPLTSILLVEDNPGDARLMREYLIDSESLRFDISVAARVEEAVAFLNTKNVDIVLLDLSLPDAQELEGYERLAHSHPDVPVVVLTGLNDDSTALRAVQLGAQDYLLKSDVSPALLTRSIRYAIERHRMQAQLRNLSLVDELTGLYNRRGFLTLAEQQLKAARRNQTPMVLFFADLDCMKSINDNFGHQEGDWALVNTADILRQTFRNADIIARLGGDEFTVLASVKSHDRVEVVEQRLHENMRQMNARFRRPFVVSITTGSALFDPQTLQSVEDLLAAADKVLYEQKRLKYQCNREHDKN